MISPFVEYILRIDLLFRLEMSAGESDELDSQLSTQASSHAACRSQLGTKVVVSRGGRTYRRPTPAHQFSSRMEPERVPSPSILPLLPLLPPALANPAHLPFRKSFMQRMRPNECCLTPFFLHEIAYM